jgi:hypothetical protein
VARTSRERDITAGNGVERIPGQAGADQRDVEGNAEGEPDDGADG